MTVSLTALTWKLGQITEAMYSGRGDKAETLAGFVERNKLSPVWFDNAADNQAARELLLRVLRPGLDSGKLRWEMLELDPQRPARAFDLYLKDIVTFLHQRQDEIATALGIDFRTDITAGVAEQILARAAEQKVQQDDFLGIFQRRVLMELRRCDLAEAQAILRHFAPKDERPYFVTLDGVPQSAIKEVTDQAIQQALSNVSDASLGPKYLATLEGFIAMGLLKQETLDEQVKERILSDARYRDIKPHLRKFIGTVVLASEIEAVHAEERAYSMKHLDYNSHDPVGTAAALKGKGLPADEVNAKLKQAYLDLARMVGLNDYRMKKFDNMPAGVVTDEERTEALRQYAAKLALAPNVGDEWLNAAAAHRQYFAQGAYETALLTAVFYSTYGYHANESGVQKAKQANPEIDWAKVETMEQPSVKLGDASFREALLTRLSDPTERILGNIIVTWFSNHSSGYDTLAYHFQWLKEAISMGLGLPKEEGSALMQWIEAKIGFDDAMGGADEDLREIARDLFGDEALTDEVLQRHKDKLQQRRAEIQQAKARQRQEREEKLAVEMARARRVLAAFNGTLTEVPYSALLNVRRQVAQLVREKVNGDIERS